jgi:hypothetical protein
MEPRGTIDAIVPVCEVGRIVSWSKVIYGGLAIAEESGRTLHYRRKRGLLAIYVVPDLELTIGGQGPRRAKERGALSAEGELPYKKDARYCFQHRAYRILPAVTYSPTESPLQYHRR